LFERFTEKAIKVVMTSQEEARILNHSKLYPEHLLLGIVSQPSGIASKFLKAAGIKPDDLRKKIIHELAISNTETPPAILSFSNELQKVLTSSWDKARALGTNYISPEHLFLSLIDDNNTSIIKLLDSYDIDIPRIKSSVTRIIERKVKSKDHPEGQNKPTSTVNYSSSKFAFEESNMASLLHLAASKLENTGYEALGTEQIFQAILDNKDSDLCKILEQEGVSAEEFANRLSQVESRSAEYDNEVLFTPKSFIAINSAYEIAKELGSASITPDHILLGILREKSGLAYKILKEMGVNTSKLYDTIVRPIEKQKPVTLTIIKLAKEEARRLGHNVVGTELILLGILGEGTQIGAKVLKDLGITVKDVRQEVENIIGFGSEYQAKDISFTPRAKKLLEVAWTKAKKYNRTRIESEHLLLAITSEKDCIAMKVLENLGVDVVEIKQGILKEIEKISQ